MSKPESSIALEAERATTEKSAQSYPYLQWTPDRIAAFWDFESRHPTRYFTYLNGPEMIRQLRRHFGTSESILDYACGPGILLGHLLDSGYRVAGTDSSPRSLEVVSNCFGGRDNFLGAYSPDDIRSRGDRFDCIFVVELLEHLDDTFLDGTLEDLKRLVPPGGRIIITTPNREKLAESHLICPGCQQVFHRWQHVRSWSRETLPAVLEERGFEVLEAFSTDFSKVTGRWKAFRKRFRARMKPGKEGPHLVVICRPSSPGTEQPV